jgi:hypothetical protein
MGKNYSMNNRGTRKDSDFYETPYSMTWQLLEKESYIHNRKILEPACGGGAIAKWLGDNVTSRDKTLGDDFLLSNDDAKYDWIVTNPPYKIAHPFIQKTLLMNVDRIAMLLPLSYLHGQKRYTDKIFAKLDRVYVFTRYPMLGDPLRDDGKYRTGMQVYAWYIWDKVGYKRTEPKMRWIDNNQYVLKRGE